LSYNINHCAAKEYKMKHYSKMYKTKMYHTIQYTLPNNAIHVQITILYITH